MFATAFPAAPIIFMINMYINLKFSLNNYCNVTKREVLGGGGGGKYSF